MNLMDKVHEWALIFIMLSRDVARNFRGGGCLGTEKFKNPSNLKKNFPRGGGRAPKDPPLGYVADVEDQNLLGNCQFKENCN